MLFFVAAGQPPALVVGVNYSVIIRLYAFFRMALIQPIITLTVIKNRGMPKT